MSDSCKVHLKIEIAGLVQGVGFRPFIARLASRHRQNGWVANTSQGVEIAIEGAPEAQKQFLKNLDRKKPAYAEITTMTVKPGPLADFREFSIKTSLSQGKPSFFVLPDIATCQDCLRDLFDPASRYYHYPFVSCSHCGPRYSIMTIQPYDRTNTSMSAFKLCPACDMEYHEPDNRRFHAQTIACPQCGPELQLLDGKGAILGKQGAALSAAFEKLNAGHIVAIKSIGGFQLIADAANETAVALLRQRKYRPEQPFALMARDLAAVIKLCVVGKLERQALLSPAAPIVLLKRRDNDTSLICKGVAPETSLLGVMLPYSPLHHLLLSQFDHPLVATSGNCRGEPICIDAEQALLRLSGVADYFLTHNRQIMRPLDDSIVRVINGKLTALRRARGYAPLPITMPKPLPDAIALGGHLKNTIAISSGKHMILSQHLGDLDSEATQQQYQNTIADTATIYQVAPAIILHDLHKAYVSSQCAETLAGIKQPVQHHYAHALSCMAEHGLEPPALGIVWDGSGMGNDETLWGGEFLKIHASGYQRFAHFRSFPLPGGVKAIREPRRVTLGLLYEIDAKQAIDELNSVFTQEELELLKSALKKQLNCPRTTSVGRLFDAIASMSGLRQISSYEGQAAMLVEIQAQLAGCEQRYPFELKQGEPIVIDWQLMIEQLLDDRNRMPPALIAAKFHNTLADVMLALAKYAKQETVVLSGGCFQNAVLVEKAVSKLKAAGFNVYCHERIPPNDGGLALGQLAATNYLGR